MRNLSTREQKLVALAQKGGNDADLLLLKEIEQVDEKVDAEVETLSQRIEHIQLTPGEKGDSIKGEDGHTPTEEELISLIKPLIPEVKDGETPTEQELVSIIKPLIPKPVKGDKGDTPVLGVDYVIPEPIPGINGSPDTGEHIIEKINEDETGLIKKEKVEGIDSIEREIKAIKLRPTLGGAKGIGLYIDGSKKLLTAQQINLIGGTNVTLTYNYSNGRNDITISAAGSAGGGILAATGAVDGSNTLFAFASAPSIIIVDGVPRQKTQSDGTQNWTGTDTITLAVAPNFDVYGIA